MCGISLKQDLLRGSFISNQSGRSCCAAHFVGSFSWPPCSSTRLFLPKIERRAARSVFIQLIYSSPRSSLSPLIFLLPYSPACSHFRFTTMVDICVSHRSIGSANFLLDTHAKRYVRIVAQLWLRSNGYNRWEGRLSF